MKIPKQFYAASAGSFGRVHWKNGEVALIEWTNCREEFVNNWPRIHSFMFCVPYSDKKHRKRNEQKTIQFMEDIQDELDQKLTIRPTTDPGILYVELPKFWRQRVARSLLTIFLRAGTCKVGYLEETKYAVRRFMTGHTTYKGRRFAGWYDTFFDMPEEMIDKVLI